MAKEKKEKKKKPLLLRILLWVVGIVVGLFVALIIIALVLPDNPARTDSPPEISAEPSPVVTPHPTPTPEPDPLSSLKVKTGEILDVKQTGDIVVVKVRVNQLLNNKQTINQNYFNACAIMRSLGDVPVSELQYWAVTPNNGKDVKIISFTVPGDVVSLISKSTPSTFADNSLPDYVTDLWVLPSLQN